GQIGVTAVPRDRLQRIAYLVSRVGTVCEKKIHDGPLVLAHGKTNRLEVFIFASDQLGIPTDALRDGVQVSGDRGAYHRPDVHATSPRPGLVFLAPERV